MKKLNNSIYLQYLSMFPICYYVFILRAFMNLMYGVTILVLHSFLLQVSINKRNTFIYFPLIKSYGPFCCMSSVIILIQDNFFFYRLDFDACTLKILDFV